jgi:hypothetical protein
MSYPTPPEAKAASAPAASNNLVLQAMIKKLTKLGDDFSLAMDRKVDCAGKLRPPPPIRSPIPTRHHSSFGTHEMRHHVFLFLLNNYCVSNRSEPCLFSRLSLRIYRQAFVCFALHSSRVGCFDHRSKLLNCLSKFCGNRFDASGLGISVRHLIQLLQNEDRPRHLEGYPHGLQV